MKFYSDVLNKFFETAEECTEAEETYALQKQEIEKQKKEKQALISKDKKELSDAIKLAEDDLSKAYENYDFAKEEARKILEESNQKILDLLNPAEAEIKKCQKARYDAISNFNKKYGAYTVQYTGDKAFQELKRASNWFDDFFKGFFW